MSKLLAFPFMLLAACSSDEPNGPYHVATCGFGSAGTACAPIRVPDSPRDQFVLAFTLVDPNPGVPPGCAGTVELEVSTAEAGAGQVRWHAQELDAATCADVGLATEGSGAIDGGRTVDLTFPVAAFTFRIEVMPTDDPVGPSSY